MTTNKEILELIRQLTTALSATIDDAGHHNNPVFFRESIKQSALNIFDKAQLLSESTEIQKTETSRPVPEIKIIKQEEVQPVAEKIVIEEKPIRIEVKAEPAVMIEKVIEKPLPATEKKEVAKPEEKIQKPSANNLEEEEEDNSLNARLAKNQQPVINVADKLKDTPVKELAKAISISKKFEFINGLFKGNAEHYKSMLQTIENCSGYDEASEHIGNHVAGNNDWDENEDLAAEFFALVKRRFI